MSLPVLSALCGMELTQDISRGVFLCMIFTPVMHTVYMFTLYYEATKRFALSMAFAIIPDSCLYALMMAFLIPIIGKDGIWLAITGNQVIGLIILVPLVLFIAARMGRRTDRLLLLPENFYSGTDLLEFEILSDKADAAEEMEMVREPLKNAVSDMDKTDTVIRCAAELVYNMQKTSTHIHIRLRTEGEKTELFIRSLGKRWNMPESVSEEVTAIGGNECISYSYIYKMNIVCITLLGSG